ncbi:MAG TPA: protoporphyrinogen oxidase [Verrucomicrobiae bacterium]|nr:protoporphyrinogen oxidase [Verrucomicrobiae bacterium]
MKTAAVIGGGITGLTAAFRLQERGINVTLYEAGPRVGGVIQSVRRDGFLAECGPNTILETSPKIIELVEDLGLTCRRMYSSPAADKRYLVRNGKPVSLPGSLPGFIGTSLFSASAKLRLLAEPFIPPASPKIEESVAQFVLRRLGHAFLDYAINPLVGGIYAGDPEKLSVRQAFPKLHALEQKYHSLIAGQVLGARERKRRAEVSKQTARKFSFDEGLQVLTDQLQIELDDAIHLNSPIGQVARIDEGWQLLADVEGRDQWQSFDAVLFTGTAHKLAKLHIAAKGAPSLAPLSKVYYPPIASIVLGFRREDVAHPLDGFGVLVPEVERFNILGAIFSSSLFPNRAPDGHVALTCYLGGARNPKLALLSAETQVKLAFDDLRKLFGITGEPVFRHHFGFAEAIPQYEVGYGRYKELMANMEEDCPGFFIAGHYRDGISLSDSIVAGDAAAQRVSKYLDTQNPKPLAADMQLKAAA